MKWEDFEKEYPDTSTFTNLIHTNIECPKCGKPLFQRTDIVLTTWPAQYVYKCECGFSGHAFKDWSKRYG